MLTPFLIAVTSGLISLLVAYFTAAYKFSRDRRMLEHELNQRLLERLYSLRLERYPAAFEITEWIRRKRRDEGGINSREELLEIQKQLWAWKTGEISLVLSKDALDAFYELVERLKKPCEDARNNRYSDVQIDKIIFARNNFRGILRSEIGHRHTERRDHA